MCYTGGYKTGCGAHGHRPDKCPGAKSGTKQTVGVSRAERIKVLEPLCKGCGLIGAIDHEGKEQQSSDTGSQKDDGDLSAQIAQIQANQAAMLNYTGIPEEDRASHGFVSPVITIASAGSNSALYTETGVLNSSGATIRALEDTGAAVMFLVGTSTAKAMLAMGLVKREDATTDLSMRAVSGDDLDYVYNLVGSVPFDIKDPRKQLHDATLYVCNNVAQWTLIVGSQAFAKYGANISYGNKTISFKDVDTHGGEGHQFDVPFWKYADTTGAVKLSEVGDAVDLDHVKFPMYQTFNQDTNSYVREGPPGTAILNALQTHQLDNARKGYSCFHDLDRVATVEQVMESNAEVPKWEEYFNQLHFKDQQMCDRRYGAHIEAESAYLAAVGPAIQKQYEANITREHYVVGAMYETTYPEGNLKQRQLDVYPRPVRNEQTNVSNGDTVGAVSDGEKRLGADEISPSKNLLPPPPPKSQARKDNHPAKQPKMKPSSNRWAGRILAMVTTMVLAIAGQSVSDLQEPKLGPGEHCIDWDLQRFVNAADLVPSANISDVHNEDPVLEERLATYSTDEYGLGKVEITSHYQCPVMGNYERKDLFLLPSKSTDGQQDEGPAAKEAVVQWLSSIEGIAHCNAHHHHWDPESPPQEKPTLDQVKETIRTGKDFSAVHGVKQQQSTVPVAALDAAISKRVAERGMVFAPGVTTKEGLLIGAAIHETDEEGSLWDQMNLKESDWANDHRPELEAMLAERAHLFDYKAHKPPFTKPDGTPFEVKIELVNDTPAVTRAWRLAPEKLKVLDKHIDTLLESGVIYPTDDSDYSAVTVLVKKPGRTNELRVTTDYRKLNAKCKKYAFMTPTATELFNMTAGATCFSTVDVHSAFYCMAVRQCDQHKLAFSTPHRGMYTYNRMPQGWINSPQCWAAGCQKMLMAKYDGPGPMNGRPCHEFCAQFVDDLLIFSNDEYHLDYLKFIFKILEKHNLSLRPDKCFLGQRKVKYLGVTLSAEGLRVDQDKVKAMFEAPKPIDPAGVRRFYGAASFMRQWIPNFAERTASLTNLLKKESEWNWTDICDKEYDDIITELTNDKCLAVFDWGKEVILRCDASGIGYGACIWQQHGKHRRMVSCASKRLNDCESKRCARDLECGCQVWACQKFRPMLMHRKFIIEGDHAPLLFLSKYQGTNRRLYNYSLILSEYDYKFVYKKGITMWDPDWLSRHPGPLRDHDPHDPDASFDPQGGGTDLVRNRIGHNTVPSNATEAPIAQVLQADGNGKLPAPNQDKASKPTLGWHGPDWTPRWHNQLSGFQCGNECPCCRFQHQVASGTNQFFTCPICAKEHKQPRHDTALRQELPAPTPSTGKYNLVSVNSGIGGDHMALENCSDINVRDVIEADPDLAELLSSRTKLKPYPSMRSWWDEFKEPAEAKYVVDVLSYTHSIEHNQLDTVMEVVKGASPKVVIIQVPQDALQDPLITNRAGDDHIPARKALREIEKQLTDMQYLVDTNFINSAEVGGTISQTSYHCVAHRMDGAAMQWPEPLAKFGGLEHVLSTDVDRRHVRETHKSLATPEPEDVFQPYLVGLTQGGDRQLGTEVWDANFPLGPSSKFYNRLTKSTGGGCVKLATGEVRSLTQAEQMRAYGFPETVVSQLQNIHPVTAQWAISKSQCVITRAIILSGVLTLLEDDTRTVHNLEVQWGTTEDDSCACHARRMPTSTYVLGAIAAGHCQHVTSGMTSTTPLTVNGVLKHTVMHSFNEIAAAQNKDADLKLLKRYLLQRAEDEAGYEAGVKPANKTERIARDELHEDYRKDADYFHLSNDAIMHRDILNDEWLTDTIVLPPTMITTAMEAFHDSGYGGHLGAHKTRVAMQQRVWFPRLRKKVQTYVDQCSTCKISKAMRRSHAGEMKSSLYCNQFEDWAVDLQGPYLESTTGMLYHLHLVDLATNWNVSVAIPNKKAKTVADAIHRHLILSGPTTCPKTILSDLGTEFTAELTGELFKQFGIRHLRCTASHPTGNAVCERQHRTYNSIMRTFLHKYGKEWDESLPYACFCINTHAIAGTNISPYELVYGQKPEDPNTVSVQDRPLWGKKTPQHFMSPAEQIKLKRARLDEVMETVNAQRLQTIRQNQSLLRKVQYSHQYQVGDLVLRWTANPKIGTFGKLAHKCTGPYEVVGINPSNRNVYQLVPLGQPDKDPSCHHVREICPYLTKEAHEQQEDKDIDQDHGEILKVEVGEYLLLPYSGKRDLFCLVRSVDGNYVTVQYLSKTDWKKDPQQGVNLVWFLNQKAGDDTKEVYQPTLTAKQVKAGWKPWEETIHLHLFYQRIVKDTDVKVDQNGITLKPLRRAAIRKAAPLTPM